VILDVILQKSPTGTAVREMTIAEIQEALDFRRDGSARAWDYRCSHSWFEIRITSPSRAGNFHLRCGSCTRCAFDIHWERPEIHIEQAPKGAGYAWLVRDKNHLVIHCDMVVGEFNVQPVFQ